MSLKLEMRVVQEEVKTEVRLKNVGTLVFPLPHFVISAKKKKKTVLRLGMCSPS